MKKRYVTLIFIIFAFILINIFTFIIVEKDKNIKINKALDSHLSTLKTHYEIILHNQKNSANAIYKTTIDKKEVIDILSVIKNSTSKQRDILREKLHKFLSSKYDAIKDRGVLQYHFVLPNNHVFLRMHKPEKFGDDLSKVRADFAYVNKFHKQIRGFEQGRTAHGFRNVYPIFGYQGEYL